MAINHYDAYLDATVDSASPLELIHLAYECAIGVVVEARDHLEHKRIRERSHAITRAVKILMELKGCLDHKAAREMSRQLDGLYTYMIERLREANFRQATEPLKEVEGLLRTVGESWSKLASAETQPEIAPTAVRLPEPGPDSPWMQPVEDRSYCSAAYGASYSL